MRSKPTTRSIGQFFFCLLVSFALAAVISPQLNGQEEIPNLKQERPDQFAKPFLIEFKGEINWKLGKYARSKIHQAKTSGADLLIFEIDSPGGLKTESLNLAELIRDIDWAYTVAHIPREALSGAALISFGFDELIVGEFSRFGDIGVIQYDPVAQAFRFAPEKIQSVLIRQARDLAASKGRSGELAEAMINKDFNVYQRQQDGVTEFRGQDADDEKPGGDWDIVPETSKGFLTLNGVRAKELGLASSFSDDRESLSETVGFELKQTQILKHTFTDDVVYYLNLPFITGLLIFIGLVAFFMELSVPGIGVGALISGLCATLFFWSRFLGGTSTWLEIVLFGAGVVFLMMELFVIPGWGVSGVMGLGLLIISVVMASQDFILPTGERETREFFTSLTVLLCSGVFFIIAATIIVRNIGRVPIFGRMVLTPPQSETAEADLKQSAAQEHPLVSVGDWGRAESLLRPAGRAVFAGRSFDVVSDGEYIEPETQVKILNIQGNRIVVSAVDESNRPDPTSDSETV